MRIRFHSAIRRKRPTIWGLLTCRSCKSEERRVDDVTVVVLTGEMLLDDGDLDLRTVAREERARALIALGHHAGPTAWFWSIRCGSARAQPVDASTGCDRPPRADALRAFRLFRARLFGQTGPEQTECRSASAWRPVAASACINRLTGRSRSGCSRTRPSRSAWRGHAPPAARDECGVPSRATVGRLAEPGRTRAAPRPLACELAERVPCPQRQRPVIAVDRPSGSEDSPSVTSASRASRRIQRRFVEPQPVARAVGLHEPVTDRRPQPRHVDHRQARRPACRRPATAPRRAAPSSRDGSGDQQDAQEAALLWPADSYWYGVAKHGDRTEDLKTHRLPSRTN